MKSSLTDRTFLVNLGGISSAAPTLNLFDSVLKFDKPITAVVKFSFYNYFLFSNFSLFSAVL